MGKGRYCGLHEKERVRQGKQPGLASWKNFFREGLS